VEKSLTAFRLTFSILFGNGNGHLGEKLQRKSQWLTFERLKEFSLTICIYLYLNVLHQDMQKNCPHCQQWLQCWQFAPKFSKITLIYAHFIKKTKHK